MREVKVAGDGIITEGKYTNVKVMGNAKIQGDIVVDEVKIMGNAKSEGKIMANIIKVMGNADFGGNIEAGECKISGNATIKGNVSIVRLKVSGDLIIDGDCKVQELSVTGKVKISGWVEGNNISSKGGLTLNNPLKAKYLKVYGELTTPTDISGDEIIVEGKLKCEGLLNAETITIHNFEQSYCKEIGATTLKVEKPKYHLLWLSYHKKGNLTCDTIEADSMSLEKVMSREIRGKQITLSNECDIQVVEYSEQFNKTDDSIVRELIKTN